MNIAAVFTTPRRARRGRSGSSLVEVLAAMAGNMAIISLAVVSLVALGRADGAFRDRADTRRMVARLGEQLRADIHAAEQVAWDPKRRELQFAMGDGDRIGYQVKRQQWSRRLFVEGENGAGELAGAFAAPRGFRLEVQPGDASAGDLVTIAFHIPNQNRPKEDDVAGEIVAEVGRDRRLLHE